jgi:oxygen-dependent protoporphyrinogen oxidase
MRVAVVGGGIAGLAAAFYLEEAGHQVTLYEASRHLGGKIHTLDLHGRPVELGPDAFLARVPEAIDLCQAVGLGDDLVAPARGEAYLWTGGRMRRLPDGLVLGVPSDLLAVARSGVLSPAGLLRAALEPLLRGQPLDRDASVAEVVAGRFGPEVLDRLVDPLVSGINAGDTHQLSVDATTPQLAALARGHRSLLLGARKVTRARRPGEPVFFTVEGGLRRLVHALEARLVHADVRTEAPVTSIDDLAAEAVVLAVPAFAAADLLRGGAPDAADGLAAIDYASVVLTVMAYPAGAVGRPLDGSGFLVPRREGHLMTACSWASAKWPHWSREGEVLLRISAGRAGDSRALDLDDDALVARLHAEVAEAMGITTTAPSWTQVARWPRSFPQYPVGHLDRVSAIEATLPSWIAVAGAAYRGVGIPACIASARRAVDRVCAAS